MNPFISSIGNAISNANIGFCLAFQDVHTDTTTLCYKDAVATAATLAILFD